MNPENNVNLNENELLENEEREYLLRKAITTEDKQSARADDEVADGQNREDADREVEDLKELDATYGERE